MFLAILIAVMLSASVLLVVAARQSNERSNDYREMSSNRKRELTKRFHSELMSWYKSGLPPENALTREPAHLLADQYRFAARAKELNRAVGWQYVTGMMLGAAALFLTVVASRRTLHSMFVLVVAVGAGVGAVAAIPRLEQSPPAEYAPLIAWALVIVAAIINCVRLRRLTRQPNHASDS